MGVVLYRLSILAAFYACQNKLITNYALILTNTTAAFINLLFIVVLNVVSVNLVLESSPHFIKSVSNNFTFLLDLFVASQIPYRVRTPSNSNRI